MEVIRALAGRAPGARRAISAAKSAALSAMPSGTPSITTPIASPWDSPKILTLNILPKLFISKRFYCIVR